MLFALDIKLSCNMLYLLSPRLCFFIVGNRDIYVNRDDSLTSKRVIMRTEQLTKLNVLYHRKTLRVRLCL